MPNHVHVVLKVFPASSLTQILHTWKSYTAHQINALRGTTGPVWQREYFDRLLRDEEEISRAINYVLNNAAKAGLVQWDFVGEMKDLE
jgi:REP element-mobilizing transposase RayT